MDLSSGKSTLVDSLVAAAAGAIAQKVVGNVRMTDTRQDEAECGITIKSAGISLYYEMPDESLRGYNGDRRGNAYLIKPIDSPGYVDGLLIRGYSCLAYHRWCSCCCGLH